MKRLAGLALLSLLAVGCQREQTSPGEIVDQGTNPITSESVKYIHDTKHGVGCWFYIGSDTTSISCLPDSQYTVTP